MVGALESGCPLVCSRNALQSLQLGDLSKAPAVDISISPGYLETFAYSLSNP